MSQEEQSSGTQPSSPKNESGGKLAITIKASGKETYELSVEESLTVQDLKKQLATTSGVDAAQQRLIYSGRILRDPDTIGSYGVRPGTAIHLVKGRVAPKAGAAAGAASAGAAATGGSATSGSAASQSAARTAPVAARMSAGQETGNVLSDLTGARYSGLTNLPSARLFGPDGGQGPLQSPEEMMRELSSDPQTMGMLRSLLSETMSDSSPEMQSVPPALRGMVRSTMEQMLSDPESFSRLMEQAPGLANAGSAAGLNNPESMARFMEAMRGANAGDANAEGANAAGTNPMDLSSAMAQMAALYGGMPGGSGGSGGGLPGLPGAGVAGTDFARSLYAEDTRPPEERFETQLRQLNELGFVDFDRNILALRRSGGNVEGAVEALLEGHV